MKSIGNIDEWGKDNIEDVNEWLKGKDPDLWGPTNAKGTSTGSKLGETMSAQQQQQKGEKIDDKAKEAMGGAYDQMHDATEHARDVTSDLTGRVSDMGEGGFSRARDVKEWGQYSMGSMRQGA